MLARGTPVVRVAEITNKIEEQNVNRTAKNRGKNRNTSTT